MLTGLWAPTSTDLKYLTDPTHLSLCRCLLILVNLEGTEYQLEVSIHRVDEEVVSMDGFEFLSSGISG